MECMVGYVSPLGSLSCTALAVLVGSRRCIDINQAQAQVHAQSETDERSICSELSDLRIS